MYKLPPNYSIAFTSVAGNVSMSSLTLEIYNGSASVQSVSLAGAYTSGSNTVTVGTLGPTRDYYSVAVNGANGGYLSSITTISISGNGGSTTWNVAGPHNNNTVTSILITDKTTNSTLVGNTSPAPAIIVAQAVFKND